MTLLQTIDLIEAIAKEQPSVNMIVRDDVYGLNKVADNRYGAFIWQQSQHRGSLADDVQTFGFTLFYVDRIVADGANVPEVQSVGVSTLSNIIRRFADELELDALDWTIDTFTHRFTDNCAGAYASVSFPVGVDYACGKDYLADAIGLHTAEGWQVVTADGAYVLVRE